MFFPTDSTCTLVFVALCQCFHCFNARSCCTRGHAHNHSGSTVHSDWSIFEFLARDFPHTYYYTWYIARSILSSLLYVLLHVHMYDIREFQCLTGWSRMKSTQRLNDAVSSMS